jgi:Phage integrase, N-terminal SAM-like domain
MEMGAPEVEAFLTHLAVHDNVAAATQNLAKASLLFLYREVLAIELAVAGAPRVRTVVACQPERAPAKTSRLLPA